MGDAEAVIRRRLAWAAIRIVSLRSVARREEEQRTAVALFQAAWAWSIRSGEPQGGAEREQQEREYEEYAGRCPECATAYTPWCDRASAPAAAFACGPGPRRLSVERRCRQQALCHCQNVATY